MLNELLLMNLATSSSISPESDAISLSLSHCVCLSVDKHVSLHVYTYDVSQCKMKVFNSQKH